jgi:hypothetical protein
LRQGELTGHGGQQGRVPEGIWPRQPAGPTSHEQWFGEQPGHIQRQRQELLIVKPKRELRPRVAGELRRDREGPAPRPLARIVVRRASGVREQCRIGVLDRLALHEQQRMRRTLGLEREAQADTQQQVGLRIVEALDAEQEGVGSTHVVPSALGIPNGSHQLRPEAAAR